MSVVVGLCFLDFMDRKVIFPYQLWPQTWAGFLGITLGDKARSFPVPAQLERFIPWFCFPVIFLHSFTSLSEFCIFLPYLAIAAVRDL